MTSEEAFRFDDSPVKTRVPELLLDMENSIELHLMQRAPLDYSPDIGDVLADEFHDVLAMRKSGFGTKPFKKWMKEVDYHGEDLTHPSTSFWQSQVKKWKVYDFCCDPKELAAHDLLETLLMRLSFYLRDQRLLEILKDRGVYFGPFSPNGDGDYDLSYRSLAWYLDKLNDDEERRLEIEWCKYAMGFADEAYLEELAKLGYGHGRPMDAKAFGEEVMSYVTKLRNGMNRNQIAHIFSTSVKQVWMKTDRFVKTKNRCLLDLPASTLDDQYKGSLIAVLDDLIGDMPGSLHGLGNIARMQSFFLKTVLHKSVPREAEPKPANLPLSFPPLDRWRASRD